MIVFFTYSVKQLIGKLVDRDRRYYVGSRIPQRKKSVFNMIIDRYVRHSYYRFTSDITTSIFYLLLLIQGRSQDFRLGEGQNVY